MNETMKTDSLLRVWIALATLTALASSLDIRSTNKAHPVYKYGYVVSHKEGGSQAHVETRNGNMTLGRYYVNFPNGSGQKVTYLADDVGFHTGVVYSSQTKKGSSKTRIAMGQKAMATLESLDGTQPTSTPKIVSSTPYGIISTKVPASTVTVRPDEDQSNVTYPFSRGYYLVRRPVESVTSNHIEPSSESPTADSDVQQTRSVVRHTTYPSSVSVQIQTHQKQEPQQQQQQPPPQQQQLEASLRELNAYLPTIQQRSNVPKPIVRDETNGHVPMFTNDRSIEKTFLSDLDAQLISKIQKHADGVIMNDLKKGPVVRVQSQRYVYTVKPELKTVTMQPIVVADSVGSRKPTNVDSNVKKSNKNVQSGSINSLRVTEKGNGGGDQISKTSEVAVNVTKSVNQFSDLKAMNRNSDSANFTLCESNLCVQDNNRAFSDSLVAIKPRPDIALGADIPPGSKFPSNFYPKNQLKHEMHYVTTIDVQKGISLEVQQNEDGSIRLANNFPFNKLPNYQRPFNPSTPAPVLSNSITPAQNVHLTPQKPYFSNSVTPAPELYDVTPSNPLPQTNQNVHLPQHYAGNVKLVYHLPQPISSGITHIMRDQIENAVKPSDNSNVPGLPQPQTGIVFINHQSSGQGEDQKKHNFVEEERKEYFENLKKVEEITQQNSASPQPEISVHSNGLTEDATPAPILPIESNSVKPTGVDSEQQVHYVPEVQPVNYQNEVGSYGQDVGGVTYPAVQQVPSPVVYQKPVFAYAPEYVSPEHPNGFYEPQHVQNVFIDNSIQQPTQQSPEKQDDLTNYAFPEPTQAEERVQQVQLAVPSQRINTIPLAVGPGILRQDKSHPIDKTILLNPVMAVDYGRAFKVQHPVSFLGAYPMQLQSGSELSSIYQLPQQYQLSVPIQLPQPQNIPAPFPPPSFTTPVSPGQYHVTMSYKPTPNKLRIQPLKPSPPPEEETRMEAIQNLFPQAQAQFPNPTYYYAGFPTVNRLQLRQVSHGKKNPNLDQFTAQSVTRRDKSLKNLKIEYGFKPPLRPSVEFSEEVKPSIYGPSVQLR